MHRSHKQTTSSFSKFVAHLQHSLSSQNIKSSTIIKPTSSSSSSSTKLHKIQLSEILYDPTRSIEYINEIKDTSTSCSSINSTVFEQDDQINLSQMNISHNHQRSPKIRVQLPKLSNRNQLHSTAIHDRTDF